MESSCDSEILDTSIFNDNIYSAISMIVCIFFLDIICLYPLFYDENPEQNCDKVRRIDGTAHISDY